MEDVSDRLAQIRALVENARAMPMSSSCVVNRAELLELLDALEAQLPTSLVEAHRVLEERQSVVDEGRREAAALIARAEQERQAMLSQEGLWNEAQAEAHRMLDEARAQAYAMRLEVEDYVDSKLANFEIVLSKTLQAVQRGRSKLTHPHPELAELSGLGPADAPAVELNGASTR